jgi:uncharacterized protein (TIGR00299 family) protein
MLLGAMLDSGLSEELLRAELAKLGVDGYRLRVAKTDRGGLAATQAVVELDDPEGGPHRRLGDMLALIAESILPLADKERIGRVFRRLAEAEARAHGTDAESAVLHELGSLDTVIDVAGAVAGLRLLAVEELYASALPLGSGSVESAHGLLPVPAPAALLLMAEAKAPATESDQPGEFVTPTGAAIVTTLARFERPAMTVEAVGHGAGSRNPPDRPNLLRLWLGERLPAERDRMLLIETNIDDMTAELLGYVQERLFAAGAADVWFTPIQMKKNRPATKLSLLCSTQSEDLLVKVLLAETSTLGVRVTEVRRHETRRRALQVETSLGTASVKVKNLEDGEQQVSPEYEDCRRIAQERNLPLAEVYRIVESEARAHLEGRTREDSQ